MCLVMEGSDYPGVCGAGFNSSEPETSSALQGNVTSGEDYSIVVKRLGHKSCFPSLLI